MMRFTNQKIIQKIIMKKNIGFFLIFTMFLSLLPSSVIYAQEISIEDFVTYSKQSNFIKEIPLPTEEFGLRGITTDNNGNPWMYYATQDTSSIFKFDVTTEKFSEYAITEMTKTNDLIINLSGGNIVYDELRNYVWFTDARTNTIGKFIIDDEKTQLIEIPTENSGPMGLILSPDQSKIWFTELSANKFASLNIESNEIKEYSLDEGSGPTLLAFDEDGALWITLSYARSVLKINLDNIESEENPVISKIALPKPDFFAPFGIEIFNDSQNVEKLVLSDHGSNRVIVSEIDSNLKDYVSLWTSVDEPSSQTLPSQIVADESGIIYFVQHAGNKVSKIDNTGIITEYEIPTGPLTTVIYLSVSEDGQKVWFTEVLGNKIGYLDTSITIPFDIQPINEEIVFTETKKSEQIPFEINSLEGSSELLSLDTVNLSLTGMTDSGLDGISYTISPDTINLNQNKKVTPTLNIDAEQNIESGIYQIMLQVSASETTDETMKITKLYPLTLIVDLPKPEVPLINTENNVEQDSEFSIRDVIQSAAIIAIIGLLSLLAYKRIKMYREKNQKIS